MKQRAEAIVGLSGVVGDGACRQVSRGTWETRQSGWQTQRTAGIHNRGSGSGRESERLIVAKKRGNACGAKGPCWRHAEQEEGRTAWIGNISLRRNRKLLRWSLR